MASKRRGILSWLAGAFPATRQRRRQIVDYARAWDAANERVGTETGPLWVVLGDSTAQAIGADSYDHGYVGQVLDALRRHDGRVWRAVNLSQSGALAIDVVEEQLPGLSQIGAPDLVSCAVGSNDLLRRTTTFEAALAEIARALPVGALLANLPRGLRERRAQQVNGYIERVAREHHLRLVDLWSTTGPPWRDKFSADRFHPNEVGYRDWTTAFCAALGIQ